MSTSLPPIDSRILAEFCTAHGIREVRVFGSVARGESTDASDLDLLITFMPGVDPDLFELGGLQQDLSALFSRTVDLKTPEMFSPANLQRVMSGSVVLRAA